ncbi:MAG: glycosyltransferase family 2 protein [Candidatus Omnitrophica bacterium]|nr:glycosyltransferase family 2 protein [Candidatus Omnitrophota bacterium]
MGLSAVIITLNEERNLETCLKALDFCDEKVIVDGGSRDATLEIARRLGAAVYSRTFTDYASQKNFAAQKASNQWLLFVDADERVSPELAQSIRQTIARAASSAYRVHRKNRIFGRWMKHGVSGNDRPLRLVQKEKAIFSGLVHEAIAWPEKTPCLSGVLWHHSTERMTDYMKKLNQYTALEAALWMEQGRPFSKRQLFWRPPAVFLDRVFWRAGILDGMEGFFFSFLSAYYEFVKLAKRWEKGKGVS